jgi:hypothetical protein
LSIVLAGALLVSLVYHVYRRREPTLLMVVAFGLAYVGVSIQSTLDWQYFALALPLAAVLTAAFVADLPRIASVVATAVIVGVALFNLYFVSWGGPQPVHRAAEVLGSPGDSVNCEYARLLCTKRPRDLPWPGHDALSALFSKDRCTDPGSPCELFVVSFSNVHASSMRYHVIRDWPDRHLRTSTVGTKVWGELYPLRQFLEAEFILHSGPARYARPGDYRRATTYLLDDPPVEFARTHAEVFRSRTPAGPAVVLRRTAPLTSGEVLAVVQRIELEEHLLAGSAPLLGELYREEGELELAIEQFERAAAVSRDDTRKAYFAISISRMSVELGRLAEAFSWAEESARLDAENPSTWVFLARLHLRAGQIDRARETLARAEARFPEDPRVRGFRRELDQVEP